MTIFAKNFIFLDAPGSEVVDLNPMKAMKAAGFDAVFCNIHSYLPIEWDTARKNAELADVICGPWARIDPTGNTFYPNVLDYLIDVAHAWNAPYIINAEAELKATGDTYTKLIAQLVGTDDAAISMEPWLFTNVDWKPVAHLPMLLQIFPVEQPLVFPPGSDTAKQANDCLFHAHELGIECAYYTFGTYRGMEPTDFNLQAPYSLFTGNTCGAVFAPWAPTSIGFKACKEVVVVDPWYKKPYKKGSAAIGPTKLPRVLKPNENMTGDDVLAMKRIVSHAQRWMPWAPSQWDKRYNTPFAMGKGTGNVGDSGVKGFQRQEGITENGEVNDVTYQRMRRALIPIGPRQGDHILDAVSINLINDAIKEFSPAGKLIRIRSEISDFCERAEVSEALWHYTQRRPYTGLGDLPERSHENDCSSYVILAYWWARQITSIAVPDPSGYRYAGYGNTWDDLDGHPRVTTGNYFVSDLAHYDGHVTICRKAGNATASIWSSFGQESGPEALQLYYRPDFRFVVRPKLM